jgi:hypothetical protein
MYGYEVGMIVEGSRRGEKKERGESSIIPRETAGVTADRHWGRGTPRLGCALMAQHHLLIFDSSGSCLSAIPNSNP